MKSGQMHWHILNVGMYMRELTISLNILNNLKDSHRICGDFIFKFTVDKLAFISTLSQHSGFAMALLYSLLILPCHVAYYII
jgi:hypothetical protein